MISYVIIAIVGYTYFDSVWLMRLSRLQINQNRRLLAAASIHCMTPFLPRDYLLRRVVLFQTPRHSHEPLTRPPQNRFRAIGDRDEHETPSVVSLLISGQSSPNIAVLLPHHTEFVRLKALHCQH